MSQRHLARAVGLAIAVIVSVSTIQAGPELYRKGDSWFDVGLLVETQYRYNDPDDSPSNDELFFRRLRPTFVGAINEDWQGILQLDFGAGQNGTDYRTTIRWVNFQYTGVEKAHVTIGSFKHYFSREFVTLGPHLQTIERTFLGDNTFGNPGYTVGVSWDQLVAGDKLFYAVSVGAQNHHTPVTNMAFSSPPNTDDDTANQGFAVAGRVDYYLFGKMPWDVKPLKQPEIYNRGDFHTDEWRVMVSAAAYSWSNDDDNNTYTDDDGTSTSTTDADMDSAFGVELSGGVRGHGFSGDLELQRITGDLIDTGFTGGLYQDGSTDLDKLGFSAGYMFFRNQVEVVGAWTTMDATNYDKPATITTVGLNWFAYEKYAIRFSGNYSLQQNQNGVDGQDEGIVRLQAQLNW
jgi:hypothetical protein